MKLYEALKKALQNQLTQLIRSSSSQINCVQRRRLQFKDQPKGRQLSAALNLTPNHSRKILLQ